MIESRASTNDASPSHVRTVSGKGVVIGMLTFGVLTTTLLFVYWTMHTAPFRDIQEAIAQDFPGSKPRVDGGQRKQHKQTEFQLRVTMQAPFDPTNDIRQTELLLDNVTETINAVRTVNGFDKLVFHLYWPIPEDQLIQTQHERAIAEKPYRAGRK